MALGVPEGTKPRCDSLEDMLDTNTIDICGCTNQISSRKVPAVIKKCQRPPADD